MTLRIVIFDFDGTLVKTREASWQLFQRTSREFGLGIDRPVDFYALFQRNLFAALDDLCPDDPARAARAREHFQTLLRNEYTPDLVPGMADVVRMLASHVTLVLLSSNTMQAVRRTLEHHGIAFCFAHAFTGDVEPDKTASIRRVLEDPLYTLERCCEPTYPEHGVSTAAQRDGVLLVTDTVGDVGEARAVGIRVIGVAWGMHSREDLLAAGAEFVAIWPQEILSHLLAEPAALHCSCVLDGDPSPARAGVVARQAAATRRRRHAAIASLTALRYVEAPVAPPSPTQEIVAAAVAYGARALDGRLLDAVGRICAGGPP